MIIHFSMQSTKKAATTHVYGAARKSAPRSTSCQTVQSSFFQTCDPAPCSEWSTPLFPLLFSHTFGPSIAKVSGLRPSVHWAKLKTYTTCTSGRYLQATNLTLKMQISKTCLFVYIYSLVKNHVEANLAVNLHHFVERDRRPLQRFLQAAILNNVPDCRLHLPSKGSTLKFRATLAEVPHRSLLAGRPLRRRRSLKRQLTWAMALIWLVIKCTYRHQVYLLYLNGGRAFSAFRSTTGTGGFRLPPLVPDMPS